MKTFIVKIEVPSGSRPIGFMPWLNKLLEPHRMQVTEVHHEESETTVTLPPVTKALE